MAPDPLELRNLPPLDPPEGLWQAIADRLDSAPPERTPRRRPPGWSIAAAAAAAVVVLALALAPTLRGPGGNPSADDQRLVQLQAVSAALEARLDRNRFGVVNAATADSLARIEQELAWLDLQISDAPDDADLWSERVALLGEMNQRYQRSDWQSELQLASY